jgi:hypothetical protein
MQANLPIESPLHLGVMTRFWMQSHLVAFPLMGVPVAHALQRLLTPREGGGDGDTWVGEANQSIQIPHARAQHHLGVFH